MEKAVEGGNASRESSTAVSLDHLEDEEGPPSPKAIPELIHHSSPEARVADAEPAAGKKAAAPAEDISSASEMVEDPLMSIPLGTLDSPALQELTANASGLPVGATPPQRSLSMDVETGSAKAANSIQSPPSAAVSEKSREDPGRVPEGPGSGLVNTKSLDSDAETLVIHSTASDSPPVGEVSQAQPPATIGSQISGRSSGDAYYTARGDPERSDLGLSTPAGSRNLEESFEGISKEPTTGINGRPGQQGRPVAQQGRTGVTASPPPSPKAAPRGEGLPAESSAAFRQDTNTIAEELAEAEAKADMAALAASQRASSTREQLNKKASEEGKGSEEAAPFTEETLQSTEPSKADAGGGTKARPMSPPPAAPRQLQVSAEEVQFYEPPDYAGLIFHDGIDALGRPVVVVNADALGPRSSRKDAIYYMQQRLEPIIVQGPYVIVFLNSGSNSSSRLSPGWLASCYRQLSYPFRKNVKHVILVRPSAGLKFMLAIVRPLLSPKAYVKVKKVVSLSAMAAATNSEVAMQHLGPRFAAAMGRERLEREMGGGGRQSDAIELAQR